MPYHWPADTDFGSVELDVLDRACSVWGPRRYVGDHRHRRRHTRDGPLHLTCQLHQGPDPQRGRDPRSGHGEWPAATPEMSQREAELPSGPRSDSSADGAAEDRLLRWSRCRRRRVR
ncbi:MAG: hypothetical protein JO161_09155 [Planctomycetaceae bacterium]|nr:hypothetical protein [Planctomycetaceae bacterium]